jgi:HTH-type transcriptional repressor of NAD biosynthesis genes
VTNAFVLMTALPPTKGHINLIEFANELVEPFDGDVTVIVCTQPDEPFCFERWFAIANHFRNNEYVHVKQLHDKLEQNPNAPLFWDMWRDIMLSYGVKPGDFIVTSEPYGKTLAELTEGIFMPYDPNRELYYTKATNIRKNPAKYFADVAPEFQPYLRQTVTVFGAESTGKTTLSKRLSYEVNGHWLFEWARPYLETAGNVINVDSMTAIWRGQAAIQRHGQRLEDKPWVVQDTDLFSTIGYWELPEWREALGEVPGGLVKDAVDLKSDLYLILKSNIPFEKDPLRYKSDEGVREGSDEFWIGIAEKYALNYKVVSASEIDLRTTQALDMMSEVFDKKAARITYDRGGY